MHELVVFLHLTDVAPDREGIDEQFELQHTNCCHVRAMIKAMKRKFCVCFVFARVKREHVGGSRVALTKKSRWTASVHVAISFFSKSWVHNFLYSTSSACGGAFVCVPTIASPAPRDSE